MPKATGKGDVILATLFVVTFFPHYAHAYTDPGTGLLILQVLGAGALGSLFFVRRVFKSLTNLLRGRRNDQQQ